MKIVYVVHEFPPDDIGGTGVVVLQVAKNIILLIVINCFLI